MAIIQAQAWHERRLGLLSVLWVPVTKKRVLFQIIFNFSMKNVDQWPQMGQQR